MLELRLGAAGWADPPFRVPLGPLREALPRFAGPGPWPTVVALVVLAALLALAAQQWRSRRARRRPGYRLAVGRVPRLVRVARLELDQLR